MLRLAPALFEKLYQRTKIFSLLFLVGVFVANTRKNLLQSRLTEFLSYLLP